MIAYPPPAAHMTHARIRKVGFDYHLEVRDPVAEDVRLREWHRLKIYASRHAAKRASKRAGLVLVLG